MNDGNARLALLCVAQFVVVLDATIVAIALPAIGDDLGVSATGLQWVLSAYTLTFGGLLMLAGRAADLSGRRRAFRAGLLLFAAASLACALAPTAAALVAARAVQGAGAALVAPAALALLVATEPEGARRTRALAVWTAAAAGGGASGWVLGGAISGGLGWEWVFAVNVPIGLAGAALAGRLLPESREPGAARLDVWGALTLTAGVGAVLLGLSRGEAEGLTAVATLGPLAAGLALLARVRRDRAPRAGAAASRPAPCARPGSAVGVGAALALTGATTPAMFLCVLHVQREGGARPGRGGPAVRALQPRRHRGLARRAARDRARGGAGGRWPAASASWPARPCCSPPPAARVDAGAARRLRADGRRPRRRLGRLDRGGHAGDGDRPGPRLRPAQHRRAARQRARARAARRPGGGRGLRLGLGGRRGGGSRRRARDRRRQATSRNGPRTPLARMSSSAAAPIAPGSSLACGSASGSA